MKRIWKLLACCLLSCGLLLPTAVTAAAAPAAQANAYTDAQKQRIVQKYEGVVSEQTLSALKNAADAAAGNAAADAVLAEAQQKSLFDFALMSDVHMNTDGYGDAVAHDAPGNTDEQFEDALETLYGTYPQTQLLLVNGDITCNGMEAEYQKYLMPILNYDIPVLTSIGNHEYRINETIDGVTYNRDSTDPQELERLSELARGRFLNTVNTYFESMGMPTTETVYYDRYFGGYHFILLGSEARTNDKSATKVQGEASVISDEQIAWLREKLAETDPDRPVFVFTHNPLNNTVPESEDFRWGLGAEDSDKIKAVLADYPQAIVISGHLHNGYIGDDATYVSSFGTCIDLPSFEYNVFDYKATDIGYIVNVFENCVLFTPYNYTDGTPLYEGIIRVDRTVAETLAEGYDLAGSQSADADGGTVLDLQKECKTDGLRVVPQSGGTLLSYKVEISTDGQTYTTAAEGAFANSAAANNFPAETDSLTNKIFFDRVYTARYIRYTTTEGTETQPLLHATFTGEDKSDLRALYRELLQADGPQNEALAAAMQQAKTVIEDKHAAADSIQAALLALQNASGRGEQPPQNDNTVLIVCLCAAAALLLAGGVTAAVLVKKKKAAPKP